MVSRGAGAEHACPSVDPSVSAIDLVTNSDAWVTDVAERTAHETMLLVGAPNASNPQLSVHAPSLATPERFMTQNTAGAVSKDTSDVGIPQLASCATFDFQSDAKSLANAAVEESLRSALKNGTPQRSSSSEVDGDVAKQSRVSGLASSALFVAPSSQRPRTSETDGGSPQLDQVPFRQGDAHMPPSPSTSLPMAQMETQLGCTPVRSSSMNTSESVAAHLAQQTVAELWSACGGPTSADGRTAQASQATCTTERQDVPVDDRGASQQQSVPTGEVYVDVTHLLGSTASPGDALVQPHPTHDDAQAGDATQETTQSSLDLERSSSPPVTNSHAPEGNGRKMDPDVQSNLSMTASPSVQGAHTKKHKSTHLLNVRVQRVESFQCEW